jgi:hypothetical protein
LRLRHGTINDRQWRHFIDRVESHASNDADDFRHHIALFVVAGVDGEPFADWIFTRENLLRHCLIDYDYARGILGVVFVERAATKKGHFESLEIITGDDF